MTTRTFLIGALAPPFRWTELRALVEDVNLREPQRQDRISCRLDDGVLKVELERELTEIEAARDEVAQWRALAEQSRQWIGREGESRVSQPEFLRFVQAMAKLLGNPLILDPATVGTQAPAAPPAAPNSPPPPAVPETADQRWARFEPVLRESGFKYPDDAIALANLAQQHGIELDELTRRLG